MSRPMPMIDGERRWPKGTAECVHLMLHDSEGWQLWRAEVRRGTNRRAAIAFLPATALIATAGLTGEINYILAACAWFAVCLVALVF